MSYVWNMIKAIFGLSSQEKEEKVITEEKTDEEDHEQEGEGVQADDQDFQEIDRLIEMDDIQYQTLE